MPKSAAGSPGSPAPGELPLLSVVVPTRGRATHIVACVGSILACVGPFELIIVDQSDGDDSRAVLSPFLADARFRYLKSTSRGVCAARNEGIEASRGDIFVCTDDDCRVPPDWLSRIEETFATEAATDVLCGRVTIPKELEVGGGFAAFFLARYPVTTFDTLAKRDCGITANMAFRRSAVARVGAFDRMLGSGGPLGSGGEPDFIFRALRGGLRVRNEPSIELSHLGIRRGAEIDELWKRYSFGTGAAFFKHVRLLDPQGFRVLASYLVDFGWRAVKNLLSGRRPLGVGTVLAMLRGARASLRFDVDPATRMYRERSP
jgi:glycosyltransferase involved in cell wall biosynthesis